MPEPKSLSRLTRSLAVGTSAGALVMGVGCAPIPTPTGTTATGSTVAVTVRSEAEGRVCTDAIQQRTAEAMTTLMTAYPSSRCILPVVNAMSASERARIPAAAIAGLPASIRAQLPDGTGGTRTVARGGTAAPATGESVAERARRILDAGGASEEDNSSRY
jgi:hypothetical protein